MECTGLTRLVVTLEDELVTLLHQREIADELLLDLIDGPHGPGGRLGRVGCSLVGITFGKLGRADAVQLAMRFPGEGRPTDQLDSMVDDIRARWGGAAVGRASLLGDSGGLPVLQRPTALDA